MEVGVVAEAAVETAEVGLGAVGVVALAKAAAAAKAPAVEAAAAAVSRHPGGGVGDVPGARERVSSRSRAPTRSLCARAVPRRRRCRGAA